MPEQIVVRAGFTGDRRVRPVGAEVLHGTNVSALKQGVVGVRARGGRRPRGPSLAVVTAGARAGGAQESGSFAVFSAGTGDAVLVSKSTKGGGRGWGYLLQYVHSGRENEWG